MENPQRATVAFLCGCLYSGQGVQHIGIHDNVQGKFVPCTFSNNGGYISVFDHHRACYLTGHFPSFFDYGFSQYITLTKVNDNMFSVFDYHTGYYLSVTCNGGAITVFDYAKGSYFNYQLN